MTMTSRRHSAFGIIAATVCFAGSGCTAPFAKLDGVLVDTRPALPTELGRVQIIREGIARDGQPRMSIEKGDGLVTAVDGVALLTLRAGYEVIFEPGTDATIENPSILMRLGKIIVKKLQEVKEKLTVNSQFVSAGVEGTQFVYEVTRDQTVRIAVLEGRVTVRSRAANWDSVTYVAGETGTIRPGSAPARMQRLDPADARAIRQRIEAVENAARPTVPELRGEREEAARPALQARGFVLGSVTRVVTRDFPAGIIVGTRPVAGTAARAGDRVSVQVADSSLTIPNLLGRSWSDAARILAAAGFRSPDTTSQYRPEARIGTVVGVAPSDGALVAATTRVVLTLARNTPDRPVVVDSTSPGTTCVVPRLQNLTQAEASRRLIGAKLRVGKVTDTRNGRTVTQQKPAAGLKVRCGTTVELTIGSIVE